MINKVYIVEGKIEYESSWIVGIFSNEAAADKCAESEREESSIAEFEVSGRIVKEKFEE